MTHNNYIYIAVMALVSYAIRILPLTLIRKPIKNRFVQSFLYYVPYVLLRWWWALPPHGLEQVCFRWLRAAVPWCSCWNFLSETL